LNPVYSPHRLSVAPMLDWTDKHCRYFHRLLTQHALLYTEMVTTGALLHGDVPRHLRFNTEEHAVALQLGGSDTADLAACAKLGQDWGYDEINLNCGCPSERVQRGAFGACLMNEASLVADCVKAMLDVVDVPVTVKHRIGVDRVESYDFVRDFVGTLSEAGCQVFIVHARNAWLKGLSPKENREVPPLRYDLVHRLKQDFSQLTICLNGGVTTSAQVAEQLQQVDGVMLGREAYHNSRLNARASWWRSRWWPTWSARPPRTALPGIRLPATCWACATACRVRANGARSGATTGSRPCRRARCGPLPAPVHRTQRSPAEIRRRLPGRWQNARACAPRWLQHRAPSAPP
jgi:tRNA-dihydrouridine synthase A